MQEAAWLKRAKDQIEAMPEEAKQVREFAKENLWFFARLVNPGYMYGQIHKEIFDWLQDYHLYGKKGEMGDNKLILLPRAHLKSHIMATFCAWLILRHPEITILYLSATAELAMSQLYDIKNILSGKIFNKYWPDYIHPEIGKREKWSATSIMVDHPKRKEEGVRDATIKIAGLTTNTTGWHADVICSDDIVVPENAYTEEGRDSVSKKSSQFTSIRNNGGFTVSAGTRYHPADIYGTWKESVYEDYNEDGESLGKKKVWDIKEYVVEDEGLFLWPRAVRSDGKAFGFDKRSLSRIKAEYTDRVQFFAQYYNDPNDKESNRLTRDKFQYYNRRFLKKEGTTWYYNGRRLNVYAAIDFAFSLSNDADYSAIVVIGLDSEDNIYVLDVDRFKSVKIIEYFERVKSLHSTWNFKKLNAEVTVAQKAIVESIKDYVRRDGLTLKVEEFRPSRQEGSKEQRIASLLEPRYDNLDVWHFEGGWTPVLEEELIMARPPHDDIKDAMASALSIATKPGRSFQNQLKDLLSVGQSNSRFGGF